MIDVETIFDSDREEYEFMQDKKDQPMKENEQQAIEEMGLIIGSAIEFDELDFGMGEKTEIIAEKVAKKFYNAGYRKQSEGENISQMHPSDEFICEKCGLIIRECCRYEIDEDDGDEICYEFPYRFCPRCGMKVKGGAE